MGSQMNSSVRQPRLALSTLVLVGTVAALYVGGAELGLAFTAAWPQITPFWPPAGIALAALVFFGPRAAPGVFIGAIAAAMMAGAPPGVAIAIGTGNTLGAAAAGWLLRRGARFEPSLERIQDVLALLVATGLASCITATIGITSLAAGGLVPWSEFGNTWPIAWAGDVMGIVVVAPVALSWAANPELPWRGARRIELLVLFAAVVLVGHAAFTNAVVPDPVTYQTQRVVVPLIIWAALRFGPRETSLTMLVITTQALAGALHGEGLFATGTLARHVTLVELFVGVIAPTALAVTAGMCQRRRAERELQAAHRTLEVRVEERTRELVHANAELRASSQAIGEKNEELESFVHNVSHDLRSPLHNLRGFCDELALACASLGEVVRDPKLPPEASLRVGSIVREDVEPSIQFVMTSAGRLQRLVDALTQLSRQGRTPLAKEPVDLHAVFEATRDLLRTSIAARGATLTAGTLPTVRGDATALERVFTNLIGNALAYLDPARVGQIDVGTSPADDPDGRDAGMVHVWVRDNGRGIPTRDQPKVFQVFQRFHPDAAPGEGIGLAIVKRIVERHGGRVWATSEEDVGSVFHLTLPT